MNVLRMLSMINDFPIGSLPNNRAELLSKASIISFLSRFQEQFSTIKNIDERELMVRAFLGEVLGLEKGEELPSLVQAEGTLKLSSGFIQDYGKIQYIKENKPSFNETYDMIAYSLGLKNEISKKAR